MPPRSKQASKRPQAGAAASKKTTGNSRSRSRTPAADAERENRPPVAMPPPAKSSRRGASGARNKSRDASKLDESMKSAEKALRVSGMMAEEPSPTPAALQAQHELEIQQAFGSITEQILSNGPEATAVTTVMKRTLVVLMRKSPALFQKTLLAFIDRLLTLEVEDSHGRNFYLLLSRLFREFVQARDRSNGAKLVKSVLRHLLETYKLPKLLPKLQQRTGHMLALTITATASLPAAAAAAGSDSDEGEPAQAKPAQDGAGAKASKASRVFTLLDESRADQEMRRQLEETVLEMLATTGSPFAIQAQGIQIASLISNFEDDRIFNQLMKLLMVSRSAPIREKIIKAIRVPYSPPALAFLGKRLRDQSPNIVELVFKQMTTSGVTIRDFPTPEARMLVLTEGFTCPEAGVREACIDFLRPIVNEYAEKNDIAGVLKLIEAKLAFGNQYFGRIPGFLILAILEILEADVTLADYLEKVVLRKLRLMAGIPLNKVKKSKVALGQPDHELDADDLFGEKEESKLDFESAPKFGASAMEDDGDRMEVDEKADSEELPMGPVTFEEMLLLRLAFELNRSTRDRRTQYYLDRLDEIVPEYEDYRKICFALASMDEPNLPSIDPKQDKIRPFPKGQVGFARRAILGEWIKFSLMLNIQDEVVRSNLTTLCFEVIGKMEYSYADYEHLLAKQTQLLKCDDENGIANLVSAMCANPDDDDDEGGIEAWLERSAGARQSAAFEQEAEGQEVEIRIRNFPNIGTTRSLQEYCKPFAMETLTLDFDDVGQVAVTVAKALMGDRADEFQLKVMEAISDIKETVQEETPQEPFAQQRQAAAMFSQLPAGQQPDMSAAPSFGRMRAKFEAKMHQKVDAVQSMAQDADEFDIEVFNKNFRQLRLFVQLVEETHLKEKLSYKRALTLCRTLLKQCRLANVHDQSVISICETLIHPAVLHPDDKENLLLAFECIGLICILDKDVFMNYSKIFAKILQDELSPDKDNKREKVIAIKSVVDALIIHGITEEELDGFFELVTGEYLTSRDRVLRQVAIEGACKMLFTTKLCDQNDPRRVEAILCQLILQYFDQEYTAKNSLVTSILTEFFRNFAPFSERRCHMLLNALTKVMYAVMREKYGLEAAHTGGPRRGGNKPKAGPVKKRKQVDWKGSGDSGESDSEDSAFEDAALDSDDSEFQEQKVHVREICASLPYVKILGVFPTLLSRRYISDTFGLKMRTELSVVFFQRLLLMHKKLFKKTQIVKDVMIPVLDFVSLETCDSLPQLRRVDKEWARCSKMLLQTTGRVSKFQDRLNQRIQELEEIEEAGEDNPSNMVSAAVASGNIDVEMDQVKEERRSSPPLESDDDGGDSFVPFDMAELSRYWNDHIVDSYVDRGRNTDHELLEMQQIWLDGTALQGYGTANRGSSGKKSILKSPSNFRMKLGPDDGANNSSQKKQQQSEPKRVRTRRGAAAQDNMAMTSARPAHGRAQGLQRISEEPSFTSASAQPNKRVRIAEEAKAPAQSRQRPTRATKQSRGAVKSEISEDYGGESSSEEESSDDGESYRETVTEDINQSSPDNVKASKNEKELDKEMPEESSSSMQQHEDMVNDNLGRIAKNIARNYARNSKRASNDSNNAARVQFENAETVTAMLRQSMSPRNAQRASQSLVDQVIDGKQKKSMSKSATTMQKELVEDFEEADRADKAEKAQRKSKESAASVKTERSMAKPATRGARAGGMMTRHARKEQASNYSRSDEDEGSESEVFDFMDGKVTKQLKQRQKKQQQAPANSAKQAAKKTGELLDTSGASNPKLNQSAASIQSKSSMRTRSRRAKQ